MCRINDRGPYVHGRGIDLSKGGGTEVRTHSRWRETREVTKLPSNAKAEPRSAPAESGGEAGASPDTTELTARTSVEDRFPLMPEAQVRSRHHACDSWRRISRAAKKPSRPPRSGRVRMIAVVVDKPSSGFAQSRGHVDLEFRMPREESLDHARPFFRRETANRVHNYAAGTHAARRPARASGACTAAIRAKSPGSQTPADLRMLAQRAGTGAGRVQQHIVERCGAQRNCGRRIGAHSKYDCDGRGGAPSRGSFQARRD